MVTTKAVMITGASTGIGAACALHLDRLGFQVFAGVRRLADGLALQQQASGRLQLVLIDVVETDSIAAAAQIVTAAVGETGLAGLINNAGIAITGPLEFVPLEALRRQLEVNVLGQVAVTQAFLPLLRQGQGRIINMGSISGRVAMPFLGPYAASKFALEALTDSLRVELSPWGIQVAIIEPGSIATPIWQKSLAIADELTRNLPAPAHELYGTAMAALRQRAIEASQAGIRAEEVAKVVAAALTSPRPKTRYLVGRQMKLAAFAIKLLPDRLRDWLIVQQRQIPQKPPVAPSI